MATVTENINRINQAKADIKQAIIDRGVEVGDDETIDSYADKITAIPGVNPQGTIEITENGEYDVTLYETADVSVPSVDDYFTDFTITSNISSSAPFVFVKQLPGPIRIAENVTSISGGLSNKGIGGRLKIIGGSDNLENLSSLFSNAGDPGSVVESLDISELVTSRSCAFEQAFMRMRNLREFKDGQPRVVSTIEGLFQYCSSIEKIDLSSWTVVGNVSVGQLYPQGVRYMFSGCLSLKVIKMPDFGTFDPFNTYGMFSGQALEAVVFQGDTVFDLKQTQYGLDQSPDLAIYVPDDLVDSYKAHSVWSQYADKIKPVSEYEEES